MFLCFFFKQKTAYEMRISDWSSDVCSSDRRTFSHGCIRVQDPPLLAEHVLAGIEGWSRERIEAAIASGERTIVTLPQPLPEIGRASCRERVCQYVSISVVAVSLKKTQLIATY